MFLNRELPVCFDDSGYISLSRMVQNLTCCESQAGDRAPNAGLSSEFRFSYRCSLTLPVVVGLYLGVAKRYAVSGLSISLRQPQT